MDGEIRTKRLKAVRERLKEKRLNCLIITNPANVTYTTGFWGDDSWALIGPRGVYLLTDSRYSEQATKQCPHCKIIERKKPISETAAELIHKLKSLQTVAVENSTSIAIFRALGKSIGVRARAVAGIVEAVREIKDSGEVAAIRAAARIAAAALEKTRRFIKPRITENQLAGALDFEIRKLGGSNSFETIVAFGPNGSRPHHRPGERRLKKNDCVLIDFGVKYKSYCCDLTRCFEIGNAGALYKKAYEATLEAQLAAIKAIRPGVQIQQVDTTAKEVIAAYDLPVYAHGTGHGLGLEVHEMPAIAKNNKAKLQAGQVITIEPGIYIPGKLGIRIEDDILVTKTGSRSLSHIPK